MDKRKPIGYIICESGVADIPKTQIVREDTIDTVSPEGEPIKKRRVVAETILQTADVINRNKRIYPKAELFPQLESERIQQLSSCWIKDCIRQLWKRP